jgi:hypothetical protein
VPIVDAGRRTPAGRRRQRSIDAKEAEGDIRERRDGARGLSGGQPTPGLFLDVRPVIVVLTFRTHCA